MTQHAILSVTEGGAHKSEKHPNRITWKESQAGFSFADGSSPDRRKELVWILKFVTERAA